MATLLGVDVGGTFTDFLLWQDGRFRAHKRPSTPDDPSRAVLEGIDALEVAPDLVIHGSTVATNAVLERRGARTALVTTAGMRDLLVIGRQNRQDIYDLEPETPEPLVPEELRFEISAALDHHGAVERPFDAAQARHLLEAARAGGAEALAVSLLYAYANPELEEAFAEVAGQFDMYLSVSSRVSPEYREVERTATAVLNAYVGPVMARYLQRLSDGLEERGCGPLRIVQSDGGSADARRAAQLPVATLLSGPSAGVAGAFEISRSAGIDRIVTFDMGGTSTDVALCDGAIPTRADVVIGGFPARTPVVDVHTVGAGGGSIARLDAGGALRVGPQSAGADPGPASYGRGEDFTVTDAQVVLGRLAGGGLLGGAMALDVERARAAGAPLVEAFGSLEAAAHAVIAVATANMEAAVRVVSVQRGHDPREFTLVAFGGAGPLHACALADALEMPRVLIPLLPGVLAAQGAVWSDVTGTRSRSVLTSFEDASFPALSAALLAVGEEVRGEPGLEAATLRYGFDMRYAGQSYELTIEADPANLAPSGAAFHALHEQRFAHSDLDAAVEVVNVRATATVPGAGEPARTTFAEGDPAPEVTPVWFGETQIDTPNFRREHLRPGTRLVGPAVIHQLDTTTLVEPNWVATVDDDGNLILERPVADAT
ncbi:MAG: hydantoinase/oxoprolinase family protein [Chloroflexi bacterium]|nr:hydantoinase/oxoprolinase family protein [Chloroflexota bacterium]